VGELWALDIASGPAPPTAVQELLTLDIASLLLGVLPPDAGPDVHGLSGAASSRRLGDGCGADAGRLELPPVVCGRWWLLPSIQLLCQPETE